MGHKRNVGYTMFGGKLYRFWLFPDRPTLRLGDVVDSKLVADFKGIQEEDAEVIDTTNFTTSVQFGDTSTLEYLDGAQKISLRYGLGNAISTVSFSGGKSLTVVIAKARKACGLEASEAP